MSIRKKTKFKLLNERKKFYRLLIYKSIKYIYINIFKPFPENNNIILSISTLNKNIKNKLIIDNINTNSIKSANYLSEILLKKCLDMNLINKVIVDISKFRYHGKIKIIVENLKKNNIIYNKKYV